MKLETQVAAAFRAKLAEIDAAEKALADLVEDEIFPRIGEGTENAVWLLLTQAERDRISVICDCEVPTQDDGKGRPHLAPKCQCYLST